MTLGRIDWHDLPAATRHSVEQHTGTVNAASTVSAGQNSAVAALLTTNAAQVFVKGLHRDYPRRWNQDMEAMISPHVAHLAPRLLWRIQSEWDLLGFQAVHGRHADYQPGSPDLPKVAGAVAQLSRPGRLGLAHQRRRMDRPACLILRLIAHGHTTQSAENVVQNTPE